MRTLILLGTAAVVAAAAVAWTLDRAVGRSQDASALVAHTQQVLTQLESVVGTLTDAETAAFSPDRPDRRDGLDRADRTVGAELDRLGALVADNTAQQQRLPQLRQDTEQALAALHALADLRQRGEAWGAAADTARARVATARQTVRDLRLEETRLLAARSAEDQVAVQSLRWMAMTVIAAWVGVLGLLLWIYGRNARRDRDQTETLRQAKADLEAQVDARAAALRDSSARLQSIIDSTVDGIIVIDMKGRIEAFNRGAERLFGYPSSEVIGRNVSMLMPSPHHEEHDGYLARYVETGQATIIGTGREVRGRRRDGSTFPLHLSVGEMTVGGERKFTGMLHDLTARSRLDEQLRASEARWRSIVQSAVDGIVVIDAHGRIEGFNPAAERLFGYAEAEVIGRNVNILMPQPFHGEHDFYLARYLATGTKKIIGTGREVTGLKRDGTTFPLHLAVGELIVDGERRFTGILHDLSARVRMEEQLREQASLVRLGEMAAVLAHEVKNPLAGIRGAVQVIGGRLPAGSRDATVLADIVARIDALNHLMTDLLLFARPPQPRPVLVELNPLVAMTADLLRSDPALKDVEVTIDGAPPAIEADPELLKIVFVNLLVNGAQAMQGRGTIRVSVRQAGHHCRLVFLDSGPGIPADARDRLFTPFFTTKARGSGLGLPTAKRLIEAHRGTISVACPAEGGTAVTIDLPVNRAAAGV